MTDATIPVVSLQDLAPNSRKPEVVTALGKALEEFGFVAVTEHGVPGALLDSAYAEAKAFFSLPTTTKQAYEDTSTGRQRGYTFDYLPEADSVAELYDVPWQPAVVAYCSRVALFCCAFSE